MNVCQVFAHRGNGPNRAHNKEMGLFSILGGYTVNHIPLKWVHAVQLRICATGSVTVIKSFSLIAFDNIIVFYCSTNTAQAYSGQTGRLAMLLISSILRSFQLTTA